MYVGPSQQTKLAAEALHDFLLRGRNGDGGWGYHASKASRLESTCWATLALTPRADSKALQAWPAVDGLLLERQGGSANYAFHGLALLTLRAVGVDHAAGTEVLLQGLQRVKGKILAPSKINRQDNSLQGWSWIADTFSWVEPTAWCLLALKQISRTAGRPIDAGRIDIAERLLLDRCCVGGGWNYGNSNMLGQELKPFVPTTAIALLALQDRRSLEEVKRSVEFLDRHATSERSGTALSLALIALRAYQRPAAASVHEALLAQIPTTIAFGNQMAAAMALYCLNSDGPHAAFTL